MSSSEFLPEGWIEINLGELLNISSGKNLTKSKMVEGKVPVFGGNGITGWHDESNIKDETIVIGRVGYYCGSVHLTPEQAWVTDNAFITTFSESLVYKLFLFRLLGATDLRQNDSGSAQPVISAAKIYPINIVLPPLAEQKIIADKLDTLLAQVETTKARLERIPNILKSFRQSVLAAAVSGKLTENKSKWRHELLKDCFDCIDGDRGPNYPKKDEYLINGYCLFLSTKNVRQFGFDFSDTVFISKDKDSILRKGRLERGDLIITTRGTLGYVASYDEKVPYEVVRINSGMLILRKKDKSFNNDYFKILVASPLFQKLIDDQRTGSAQPQLPAKILKEFVLPVPGDVEQTEIVHRVEELFAFADTIEQKANAALDRVNNLTQSILAKAFRGELTAEWRAANPDLISGENSAEALLEKIKAEREAMKKQPK